MPKGAVVGFNCGKAELGIHPGPTLPGTPGVKPKLGIGPVMAAREERRLSAVRMPLEMLNGSPVIQLAMLDQFQPPMTAFTNDGAVDSHLRPLPMGSCQTS